MMITGDQERLVCEGALKDTNVKDIICKQLGCGKADAVLSFFGPIPGGNKRVKNITCDASSESLAECSMESESSSCAPVGLKCSGRCFVLVPQQLPSKFPSFLCQLS